MDEFNLMQAKLMHLWDAICVPDPLKNMKDRVYALKILQLSILSLIESISVCAR